MSPGRRIATFLVLVVLLCAVFEGAVIAAGRLGGARGMYVTALMWSPAVAALLTCRLTGKPIAELGWGWGETRWQLVALAVPFGYALVAYVAIWVSGWGSFYDHGFVAEAARDAGWSGFPSGVSLVLYVALTGTAGLVSNVAMALGEEIGWRGFLVPELAKVTSFGGVVLASGIIWTLYHVPILLFADYNSGTPSWYALSCFTVMIFAAGTMMAWLRLRSGSLWTAAIAHGSHNLYVQQIFTPLTGDTGRTRWAVDEFGFALPVVTALVAVYFWRRRGEVSAPRA